MGAGGLRGLICAAAVGFRGRICAEAIGLRGRVCAVELRSTPRTRISTAGLAATAEFATVEFVESRFTLASVARTSWDRFCIICHDALFVHSASWPVKLRLSKAPMVHRSIVLRG